MLPDTPHRPEHHGAGEWQDCEGEHEALDLLAQSVRLALEADLQGADYLNIAAVDAAMGTRP